MKRSLKRFAFALAGFLVSLPGLANDIPLQNWTPVPWQPPRIGRISTNANSTAFMAMAPCRVYDSRSTSALPALTSRTINIDGGPCSGIPAGASAYSINITVFGSASTGSYEFVTAYATGSARPSVSTLNFLTGTQTSNAATVPAGTAGDIDVYTTYTTHFVLDINGYYATNPGVYDGFVSVSPIGVAIRGSSTNSLGVEGTSSNSAGVMAESTYLDALIAQGGRDGVAAYGDRDGVYAQGVRYGVTASSTGTTGTLFGVVGTAASSGTGSAGVLGRVGASMSWANSSIPSGIRGDGKTSAGVLGFSENIGVTGIRANADGSGRVEGYLGVGSYGVYSSGNFAATGTKSFIEPHATDPEKVVKYVSLEGPEAGTYFRGRGTLTGGRAVIDVPEDFRMVTDPEGLTVHLTPIGRLAIVALVSADLNNIVVESNRDVEFSYIVYGVRKAFRDFHPIQHEEGEFMPKSADSTMPSGLPAEAQRRLIQAGVYNADGTVNLDTAERLGWTKIWRAREQQHH